MTFSAPFDDDAASPLLRVCFVCSGNICRSPMAEVVFRELATRAGHGASVISTSAGTGDWHVGELADRRAVAALDRRGYDGSTHRARQFDPEWFDELDLVIALDRGHERILKAWAPTPQHAEKVRLLLSFDPESRDGKDVPDPYYSDDAMFDRVLAMVERASAALFTRLEPELQQGSR